MTARNPINAADAAKRAARAPRDQVDALRQTAAGAHAAPAPHRRQSKALAIAGIAIGAALAVALVIFAGRAVMGALLFDDRAAASAPASTTSSASTTPDAVAVDAEGTIVFGSMTYSIGTDDAGAPALCYQSAASASIPLPSFTLAGDPVGFCLHEGRFYTVSNTPDGYLVQVFVPGDGSLPMDYANGTGAARAIALDAATLTITLQDGTDATVDLLAS